MTEGTLLTPLSIVMAFIGVIEATLAFRVTALQGRAQMIFVWFMVTFPAAVLAGFFYIQITSPISWYPPSELNKTTTERLKFLDRSSQKLASIELIDAANVSKSRTIGSVPQASSAIELYQAGKYEEAVKLFREERTAQRQIPNPFPTGVTRDSSNGSQHRSYIELPRSIRGSHNCLMNSNSGDQNNAFGDEALFANTTSSFNSAFGDDTLHDCTSGDSNVDMGDEAGNSITDASDNVAIGAGGRSVLRATPQPAPRRRATCQRRLSYSRLSAEGIVVYMLASMGTPTWEHSRELKIGATIFYASFSLSIIGCTLLIWQHNSRGLAVLSLFVVLAVSACRSFLRHLAGSEQLAEWLLAFATLNLFLIVPELALRVTGFRGEAGIQFGYPRPHEFVKFDPDERLFWKLRSTDRNVNSLGFPGKEIVTPKPDHRYRILFLGDSCTQQGYPDMVELLLNGGQETTARRFECITLAIAGYSSHQGRVLAELYGERLEPDLAVVYFGWNDHWQAYQAIDSQRVAPDLSSPWARRLAFFQRFKLVQGLGSLSASLRGANKPIGEVRVPSVQYRENLLTIQSIFARHRVPVVFITAPTSYYRLGVPDVMVDQNFVRDKQSVVTMHRTYNQIVREVAGSTGSYLLDLERDFDSREDLHAIFLPDGVHFTQPGLALVAKRVSDLLGGVIFAHH